MQFQFLIYSAFIAALPCSAVANVIPDDCKGLAATAPGGEKGPVIERWSGEIEDLKLVPSQLLPPSYLESLRTALGEITLKQTSRVVDGYDFKNFRINAADKLVAEVDLFIAPNGLGVDGLRIENPLASTDATQLKIEQFAKGLPPEIFRYARNQIFEIARAANLPNVVSVQQSSFSVMMLYRRLVGMVPEGPRAARHIAHIDELYKFARKEMPEQYRPADVQEFSRMLGGYSDSLTFDPALTTAWNNYLKFKTVPDNVKLLKNSEDKVMAFVMNEGQATQKIYFVDYSTLPAQPFVWKLLQADFKTRMKVAVASQQ